MFDILLKATFHYLFCAQKTSKDKAYNRVDTPVSPQHEAQAVIRLTIVRHYTT
jgi:hypothetical protein